MAEARVVYCGQCGAVAHLVTFPNGSEAVVCLQCPPLQSTPPPPAWGA